MLAASKHFVYFNEHLKKDGKSPFNRSKELTGKTIGIIGLGNIGKRLANFLKQFNVKILANSRNSYEFDGIKNIDLDSLLKESDFVCVTCQLNETSRNLISERELNLMKEDAVLTSTTGGVIDLFALDSALKNGKLFAVGLDDIDQQQVPESLINHPKVVCTYHRAYDTNESENNRINLCLDNIEAYLKGKPINLIKK